jgi:hypothetical protein
MDTLGQDEDKLEKKVRGEKGIKCLMRDRQPKSWVGERGG